MIYTIEEKKTDDALKMARRASVQATIALVVAMAALVACGLLYEREPAQADRTVTHTR